MPERVSAFPRRGTASRKRFCDTDHTERICDTSGVIKMRRQRSPERLSKIRCDHFDPSEPGRISVRGPCAWVSSCVALEHVDQPTLKVGEPGRVDRVMVPVGAQRRCLIDTQLADSADPIRIIDQRGAMTGHGVHDRLPTHPELTGNLRHRTRELARHDGTLRHRCDESSRPARPKTRVVRSTSRLNTTGRGSVSGASRSAVAVAVRSIPDRGHRATSDPATQPDTRTAETTPWAKWSRPRSSPHHRPRTRRSHVPHQGRVSPRPGHYSQPSQGSSLRRSRRTTATMTGFLHPHADPHPKPSPHLNERAIKSVGGSAWSSKIMIFDTARLSRDVATE